MSGALNNSSWTGFTSRLANRFAMSSSSSRRSQKQQQQGRSKPACSRWSDATVPIPSGLMVSFEALTLGLGDTLKAHNYKLRMVNGRDNSRTIVVIGQNSADFMVRITERIRGRNSNMKFSFFLSGDSEHLMSVVWVTRQYVDECLQKQCLKQKAASDPQVSEINWNWGYCAFTTGRGYTPIATEDPSCNLILPPAPCGSPDCWATPTLLPPATPAPPATPSTVDRAAMKVVVTELVQEAVRDVLGAAVEDIKKSFCEVIKSNGTELASEFERIVASRFDAHFSSSNPARQSSPMSSIAMCPMVPSPMSSMMIMNPMPMTPIMFAHVMP